MIPLHIYSSFNFV